MANASVINLNAKIPEELNAEFEKACIDLRINKKQGIELALQRFIEAGSGTAPRPAVQITDENEVVTVSAEALKLVKTVEKLFQSDNGKHRVFANWLVLEIDDLSEELSG